jgi:hypothetical protein
MQKFISITDSYHVKEGHMAQFIEICDWKDEGQTRLHKIYDKFKNICKLYVYELVCIEITCICDELEV